MDKTLQLMSRRARGHAAETLALNHLEAQGLTFLERNVAAAGGEIDLIFEDKDTLVFVEVRARENIKDIHPLETVTKAKQTRIIRAAKVYMLEQACFYTRQARFDVVTVSLAEGSLEWLPHAFEG